MSKRAREAGSSSPPLFWFVRLRSVFGARQWGRRETLIAITLAGMAALLIATLVQTIAGFVATSRVVRAPAKIEFVPSPLAPIAAEAPAPEPLGPLMRQAFGPPARFEPVLEVAPPYEPIDGLTFSAGTRLIMLHGVEGPMRGAVCLDRNETLWACGLQARAAFYNLISGRRLRCLAPVYGDASTAPRGAPLRRSCLTDQGDLALTLTRLGWARPSGISQRALPDLALAEAAEAARRNGFGLWNGDWRFIAPR